MSKSKSKNTSKNNGRQMAKPQLSTIDRYLDSGDVSADVLALLIERENDAREHEFLGQKQEIELDALMTKADREDAEYQARFKDIEKERQNNLAYHHGMLNMKKKVPALVTSNVQEVRVSAHREQDGKPDKYLYPSYNEVKGYINENATDFGFTFDVDCVHDPATGLDEVIVTVFHEKGAIRTYTQKVDVKYGSTESAASTKNRYVSTAAKAMLMNAFGIHFVADKSVGKDVLIGDGDVVVDYTPNVEPPAPSGEKAKGELSDKQVNAVARELTRSGLTMQMVIKQFGMKVGRSVRSIEDVKASEYDDFISLIEHSANTKNKHRASN